MSQLSVNQAIRKGPVQFMGAMYERIEHLCKERKLNITQLSKGTGIPRSVFSELKAGRTKQLSGKYLPVIADFFGTSTDYLLGNVREPLFYFGGKGPLAEPDGAGISPPPAKDKFIALYNSLRADLTPDDIDDLTAAMQAKAERNKRKRSGA